MLKYILYAPGTYDSNKLKQFLIATDNYFSPCMSVRVDLNEYNEKLILNSYIVEAVEKDVLAGIGAFYFNAAPNYSYGTFVCALKEYQNEMCGVELITKMIDYSKQKGSIGFKCEIRKSNKALVKFYETLGFVIDEEIFLENSNEINLIIHKDFK